MRILYVYCDTASEWNCSEWRCHIPANALNASGKHWARMMWYEDFSLRRQLPWVRELCDRADVIFVQRNLLFREVWDACDYWRGMGKTVVADLDDAYPILPPSNPAYKFWIENVQNLDPPPLERLEEGLRHVDALCSPSKVILDDWAHVVPGVWVPNLAVLAWWRNVQPREPDGKVIIGWGGSVSHYDSFWDSGIREALKRILRERRNVFLMLCGNDDRLRFRPPGPPEKVIFQPGVPPWEWPRVVASFDIGIAPLAGDYDRRRSWIKVMEYALAGVPCAFTDYEPYEDLRDLGVPVENSPEAWYAALNGLLNNLEEARRIAQDRYRPWALERLTLLPNVDTYAAFFDHVPVRGLQRLPWIVKL